MFKKSGEGFDGDLLLTDFALARKRKGEFQAKVGTPYYIAPEVLSGVGYGLECDIWSLGVMLYLLLSGKQPFEALNPEAVFEKVKEGKINFHGEEWDPVSEQAIDLISKMLTKNP